MPRDPYQAKGLLLASIRDANPVIFMECKALYNSTEGNSEVPVGACRCRDGLCGRKLTTSYVPPWAADDYEIPLGQAEILQEGKDITLVGYGTQLARMQEGIKMAEEEVCFVRGKSYSG